MLRLLSLIYVLFLSQIACAGFDFNPIIATLSPSGAGASFAFNCVNPGDTKVPVQITIVPREPDEDGKEDYKESDKVDEMFRIFPAQIILNPRETRTVRVSYVGDAKITTQLAFRIIAEELPVDLDDPNKVYTKAVAKIGISTRYIGSLYVTPAGAKPDVKVEARQSETAVSDLLLNVNNKGTANLVLRKPVLKIRSLVNGKEIELSGDTVKDLVNQNILAGRVRRFKLPWPKELPPGGLKVTLNVSQE